MVHHGTIEVDIFICFLCIILRGVLFYSVCRIYSSSLLRLIAQIDDQDSAVLNRKVYWLGNGSKEEKWLPGTGSNRRQGD